MRYAIIGTGGVGGYYGGRLAQSGQEVHFLLHSDYEYVKEHGLRIDSCKGDFLLPKVNAYRDTRDMPQCDVVVVCMKTTRQQQLADMLRPMITPNTVVLLIQNGIGLEADLLQQLPGTQIAGGMAFVCTAKVGPGHISHQDLGRLNIGNFSCRGDETLQQVADHLTAASIPARLVEYNESRWKKAVWNMPFNGMTVALNCTTNELLANPHTSAMIRAQMMEVVCAAHACGVENIDEAYVDNMIEMTRQMKPYKPSMRLDFDYHRPMEIDYLYTRGISEARAHGCPMPKLEMLEQELRFIESRYL